MPYIYCYIPTLTIWQTIYIFSRSKSLLPRSYRSIVRMINVDMHQVLFLILQQIHTVEAMFSFIRPCSYTIICGEHYFTQLNCLASYMFKLTQPERRPNYSPTYSPPSISWSANSKILRQQIYMQVCALAKSYLLDYILFNKWQ